PETYRDPAFIDRLRSEGRGLSDDLGQLTGRRRSQEAIFSRGIRSSMWAALRDEQDKPLGFAFVGSLAVGAFSEQDLCELEAFSTGLAWFVRPAILLEEQEAERTILEEEANLLA